MNLCHLNKETGRCMPDLSLLKPLCDILDISINELLSGKRLTKEEYQKKLEENIIKINLTTIKKNAVKTLKIVLITILSTISLFILLILLFMIKTNYDYKHIELDENNITFRICKYEDMIFVEPIYEDNMPVFYKTQEYNNKHIISSIYRNRKYYNNPKLLIRNHIETGMLAFEIKNTDSIYYKDKLIWNSNEILEECS